MISMNTYISLFLNFYTFPFQLHGLPVAPWIHQVGSSLSVFAFTVPSAWNSLPSDSTWTLRFQFKFNIERPSLPTLIPNVLSPYPACLLCDMYSYLALEINMFIVCLPLSHEGSVRVGSLLCSISSVPRTGLNYSVDICWMNEWTKEPQSVGTYCHWII